MRTGQWLGLAALVMVSSFALGFSNTQRRVDAKYRWHHQQTAPLAPDSLVIRFPKATTGSNGIPTSANSRTVDFVELVHYDLTANCDFVVWSRAFPAGKDTIRVSTNLRTKILSGFPIDSLMYIGLANQPFIGVTAAGGY